MSKKTKILTGIGFVVVAVLSFVVGYYSYNGVSASVHQDVVDSYERTIYTYQQQLEQQRPAANDETRKKKMCGIALDLWESAQKPGKPGTSLARYQTPEERFVYMMGLAGILFERLTAFVIECHKYPEYRNLMRR